MIKSTHRKGDYNLRSRGAGENAPRPAVKRLFCIECGALRDARRIGREAEFTLEPCGHARVLMSSEREHA